MPCNVLIVRTETFTLNKLKLLICCWNVVGQDPESIKSWLCFVGNMPLCAWHNRLGPWQYHVRCMMSDLSSLKLPVPHLGQDNMVKSVIWLIYGIAMTKSNRLGLCHKIQNKYKIMNEKWLLQILVTEKL